MIYFLQTEEAKDSVLMGIKCHNTEEFFNKFIKMPFEIREKKIIKII